MHARIPHVDNLQIEPAEHVDPNQASEVGGVAEELEIDYPDGARTNLVAHLLEGDSRASTNRPLSDTGSCVRLTLQSPSLCATNQS